MRLSLLIILSVTVFCFSCNNNKEAVVINYVEQDKGDSILYYSDFDWCNFNGIERISVEELSYPFVKTIYRNGELVLKAHYDEHKTNQVSFFKMQDKWYSHSWHRYDGAQNHRFIISMDTAMLELTYSGNPLDTLSERPARLNRVSVKRNNNDTVVQNNYYQFFSHEISRIPDLSNFNESEYKFMCNQYLKAKSYLSKDSIHSGYISYDYMNSEKVDTGRWSWRQYPWKYRSIFYYDFEKIRDGDTNTPLPGK